MCRLLDIARERRIKAIKLPVSAPFHCDLMQAAAEKLTFYIDSIRMQNASIPIYMNVDGQPEDQVENIRRKLILQAKSPVYWETTLRNMYAAGINIFIELGPGSTLSKFVSRTLPNEEVQIFHVSDQETLKSVTNTIRR